ncbi:MAG: protein kinase [Cyanobacteria bacterium P01_G01_bin.39]
MGQTKTLLHDRYSIVHIERTSNFSKVFFALDTYQSPSRNCLIQVFESTVRNAKVAAWIKQEFYQEAKRLKKISLIERHLPEIYTYSSQSQTYHLVRELIEGKILHKKVLAEGVMSPPEVREILIRLLSVLQRLHQSGIIHHNIKPKNIILRTEDRLPMLINFGSIKQIVTTYGFHGDKQLFSLNNSYGYMPPEQALDRSVAASDLYSLGLTAVFLLTAKHPLDLTVDSDSGVKLPTSIMQQDPSLAKILATAINPNLSDRYSSAAQMLDDLQSRKSHFPKVNSPTKIKPASSESQKNWWKVAIYLISLIYAASAGMIAWYDGHLSQNKAVRPLLEPKVAAPINSQETPINPVANRPSMLNNQSNSLVEIPIVATGTSKAELRKVMGEPNAIQQGYWSNSSAWIYKNRANNFIDLGYLFDQNTEKLRQTEVAISPAIDLRTIEDILTSLLQGEMTPSIHRKLETIYYRGDQAYSFKLNNLEGTIKREPDNDIYLGVWEADFH